MSMSDTAPEIEKVLLTVPSEVMRRAQRIAEQTRRSVETVLAEWLGRAARELPIEDLENEEILALCELQMSLSDQAELSALLADNCEGRLDEAGRVRLDELMNAYDRLLLRKSQALRAAVARGLREPLAA
jgi:hypothetical protein